MPTFACRTIQPDGRTLAERRLSADSAGALRRHLESEGHFVLELRRTGGAGGMASRFRARRRMDPLEWTAFNREFSVLLKAGLPVVGALDAVIDHRGEGKGEISRFLADVRSTVASGSSLADAVEKHAVSRLYAATLRAGERGGDLVSALERYLVHAKKVAEVRRQVVAASVYPLILTAVSVFTLAFLLFHVVPAFAGPFRDAGAELPFLTRTLLGFGEALRERYPIFLAAPAVSAAAGFFLVRTEGGRSILDRWKLELPFLGPLHFHYAAAAVARTLATVLAGGTPLVESLRVAGGVVDNRHLVRRLGEVGAAMERGERFADSLKKAGALPELAVRMIDAGEGAGAMVPVLEDVADFYDADVENRLRILTAAIEPGLMVLMGGLVGLIVLAMYLPISVSRIKVMAELDISEKRIPRDDWRTAGWKNKKGRGKSFPQPFRIFG